MCVLGGGGGELDPPLDETLAYHTELWNNNNHNSIVYMYILSLPMESGNKVKASFAGCYF